MADGEERSARPGRTNDMLCGRGGADTAWIAHADDTIFEQGGAAPSELDSVIRPWPLRRGDEMVCEKNKKNERRECGAASMRPLIWQGDIFGSGRCGSPAAACNRHSHSGQYAGELASRPASTHSAIHSDHFQSSYFEPVAAVRRASRQGSSAEDGERANERMPYAGYSARHSKRRSSSFSRVGTLPFARLSMLLMLLLSLGGPRETEGWIALSKDGYVVTRGLGLK